MKILHSSAKRDGFYLPAEFDRHYGCVMIFPERADSWQYGAINARRAFADVAGEIAKCERVTMLVSHREYQNARLMLSPDIRVVEMSSDDAWARDVSPEWVINADGVMRGVSFGFNAWGGLYDGCYFPWDKDNAVSAKLCDLYDADMYDCEDFILEGGSISANGRGTLITTESCLLSPGRNPKLTKAQIEARLCDTLGVTKIIWLKDGIVGDETNGHTDNICVFCSPYEVLLAWEEDETDPQHAICKENLEILESALTADGHKLTVHKLPQPRPIYMTEEECGGLELYNGQPTRTPTQPLSASYVNLFIANDRVIMPFFGGENADSDMRARDILQKIFPDRKVVGIYARDILIGGGNIHCITHQIPAHNMPYIGG